MTIESAHYTCCQLSNFYLTGSPCQIVNTRNDRNASTYCLEVLIFCSALWQLWKRMHKPSNPRVCNLAEIYKEVSWKANSACCVNNLVCCCVDYSADPPCIPYLGFYLTDLAFIEDGTPNNNENGLINFSKMRMVRSCFFENLVHLILRARRWVYLQVVSCEVLKIVVYFLCFRQLKS